MQSAIHKSLLRKLIYTTVMAVREIPGKIWKWMSWQIIITFTCTPSVILFFIMKNMCYLEDGFKKAADEAWLW